ncbi:Hypothetical predicted protein [Paramuricea clavata]|uniref:Uncharacterized protein n=1 Tax=Paramuricea clavata TaxID=317549 RepID=A0A7D9EDT0_PARCT|nr:Hypothetical predicted protein [Paramuricea clavata]
MGIYNGVNCIFSLKGYVLSVIESTHFTTLASWNFFLDISYYVERNNDCLCQITALEDDLWFYADVKKLIVFRTLAPTQEHSPATSNTGSFKVPSLTIYLDFNLENASSQSDQVSLCHLLEEFVSFSALVNFSEGLLIFECGNTKPVKVLDVKGIGGPRMVTLPEIKAGMNIIVSPKAFFVFGGSISFFCIWVRITEEPWSATYEVLVTGADTDLQPYECHFACCFTNDSTIAVVRNKFPDIQTINIIDPDSGDDKDIRLEESCNDSKLFCLKKDRVVIVPSDHVINFFDMESGALLNSCFQRYLTKES